ncbi:2848_t:CDS:2 [Funneliformis mosseae]|uniref:2848_t:CDS:1 n=1 Tax=Funneliformis mosseae TaxID=27381 RepID=A0A9N9E0R1_FUNMO|nr:2848_t:CDS:2 [Funneliformis mosseae]
MNLLLPFGPILLELIPALLQTNTEESLNKKHKKRDELLLDDKAEINSEVEEKQIKIGTVKKSRVLLIIPKIILPVFSDAYSNQSSTLESLVQYPLTLKSEVYTDSFSTETKSKETANLLVQQAESLLNYITLEEINSNKMLEDDIIIESFSYYLCFYVIISF